MKPEIKDYIKKLIMPVGSIALLLLCLYGASLYSFLLFHVLAEVFSIAVAFAIFLIAWNAKKFVTDSYLLFIGYSCFFVGIVDLLHTLAYKGMTIFLHNDPDLATQLWICARVLQSSSFVIAPFLIKRKINVEIVFAAFTVVCGGMLASIFYWNVFPVCFIEGQGLTGFKKNAEYLICLMLLAAIMLLYSKRRHFSVQTVRLLIASLSFMIASELMFTGYVTVTDTLNIIGHYLKIIAVFLLYRVLVKSQITNPLETMFRDLKQNEAVLNKTLETAKTRTAEVTSLLDATTNILVSQSFEESAANILSKSIDLTGAAGGYVVLCDDLPLRNCRVVAEHGIPLFISHSSFIKFFTDKYINQLSEKAIIFDNDLNMPLATGLVANVIASPLLVNGRVAGCIVLFNKAVDFTRNDLRMLAPFCELCSIAFQSFETIRLLKESEQRFELFMDNLPACAYIKDEKGNYLFVNKYFEENFCVYDSTSNKTVVKEVSETTAEQVKNDDRLVLSTGRIIEDTLTLPDRDGERIYMIKKFLLAGNLNSGLLGSIALDVTEKYEYEENIQKERKKLESILNTMENGVVIIGQDYEVKYVNPAMIKAFGKMEGRKCYRYLGGFDKPCPWCDFTPIQDGQVVHSEYVNCQSGRVYDSVDSPYVDTVTGELCKLKMLWDITEVKKAQEKIRSLSLFPSENPHAVLRILKTGEIIYSNTPGRALLEKWGVQVGDRIPDDWFDVVQQAAGSAKTIIKEIDVQDRIVAFTITPLELENYVNIYGRDITDYKNAEKALVEANNELEQRVQLRTKQLSETVGALQSEVYERLAAEKELIDNQKRLRALSQELVLSEERQRRKFAVELHDSIGQLLAFSKKELGAAIDRCPEDLQAAVRKAWQSIKYSIDLTRKLTFDLSSPTLYTLGLEMAVEEMAEEFSKEHQYKCVLRSCQLPSGISEDIQVFIFRSIRELLVNAAKHAMAEHVWIEIGFNGNTIIAAVEDDGVGFNAEDFINNRTAKKSYGLYSVRENLTNFGGRLEIGYAENKGTKVVMYIPLTEQEGEK